MEKKRRRIKEDAVQIGGWKVRLLGPAFARDGQWEVDLTTWSRVART
jgi:hypothetical protein